jgi:hypothetical protein
MATRHRKTFQEIVQGVAPRIARELELKARIASKIAKIQPIQAAALYSLKNRAVRRLFRTAGHAPLVRDAWTTAKGFLLSLKLTHTESWLHFPFDELTAATQRFYRPWVTKRARGNPWLCQSRQTAPIPSSVSVMPRRIP